MAMGKQHVRAICRIDNFFFSPEWVQVNFCEQLKTGFVQVMKNLESHGIIVST